MDKIIIGNCVDIMKRFPDECIDLTVTSPPYDNLRDYQGYDFNYQIIVKELFRITKSGGVVVWIVGDATIKGTETGTSFKQALYFKQIGFNLHDTMIWDKGGFSAVGALQVRYAPVFEYMFIYSKGKPSTFNPIKDRKNKHAGMKMTGTLRKRDGTSKSRSKPGKKVAKYGQRFNIWTCPPCRQHHLCIHPAPFPEQLAHDHILSWSNEGDIVLDPMCGSGTTCKMAYLFNRQYIGIDISPEYCQIAKKRLKEVQKS